MSLSLHRSQGVFRIHLRFPSRLLMPTFTHKHCYDSFPPSDGLWICFQGSPNRTPTLDSSYSRKCIVCSPRGWSPRRVRTEQVPAPHGSPEVQCSVDKGVPWLLRTSSCSLPSFPMGVSLHTCLHTCPHGLILYLPYAIDKNTDDLTHVITHAIIPFQNKRTFWSIDS